VTIAFSTSSPLVSVALITGLEGCVWEGSEPSRAAASQACMLLLGRGLAETGLDLTQVEIFAADLGPGSFTGVRVGVVIAKTLAWANGQMCVGADAFDLIDPDGVVFLPSRKGEFFVREPGRSPFKLVGTPEGATGYGPGARDRFPLASRFAGILGRLTPIKPEELVPGYLIEPSISQPNKPLSKI
jgi:tRNA A37 threonylcarbamoyladenosine modification protein TsaB